MLYIPGAGIDPGVDVEAYPRRRVIEVGESEVFFERMVCCGDEWVALGFLDCEDVVL